MVYFGFSTSKIYLLFYIGAFKLSKFKTKKNNNFYSLLYYSTTEYIEQSIIGPLHIHINTLNVFKSSRTNPTNILKVFKD